jgi:hypothetical protein
VRNEEALHTGKEDRIILPIINRRKSYWICHILRRVCLLNALSKEREKRREDEEENVSIYWMILSEPEDTKS